jgi:hypothetical protein
MPLALVILVAGLAACSKQPPPRPLGSAPIPSDFTFATTRGVELRIGVAPSLVQESGMAGVEVSRPDGKILFRGPVRADSTTRLKLAVPTKDDELQVKLWAGLAEKSARVSIASGAAAYTFQ